jgi:hypothetical protein
MISGVPFLPANYSPDLRSAVWPTVRGSLGGADIRQVVSGSGETEAAALGVLSVALQLGL